jgi:hypothetical protein
MRLAALLARQTALVVEHFFRRAGIEHGYCSAKHRNLIQLICDSERRIDRLSQLFVVHSWLVHILYSTMIRQGMNCSTRDHASGNRIINSNCGLGKSPGTYAARLRARVTASQATPV